VRAFDVPTLQNGSMADQTHIIHPVLLPPDGFDAVPFAVHRASTVIFPSVAEMRARSWKDEFSYTYGLRGTPTSFMLELQLAQIEGARHCLLCPSGLAAISLVNLALLKAGDEVLIPENGYGPNREQCEILLSSYGIASRLYDPMQATNLRFNANTRLIWIEAPGSVTMEVPDVPVLVQAAKQHGVLTAFDNTYGAGMAFKPFDHGVDVSVQALTKFQAGAADLLMGSVTTRNEALHQTLKFAHMRLGFGVSPEDVYLVLRSLPTMKLRYGASDKAGREVAAWLAQQPQVSRVLHPAFESCPGHDNWQRNFTGAAGLFSVLIDASYTQAQVDAFVDALKLFKIGYSWAGPMSLVVPYDIAAMRPLTAAQLPGHVLRFWIGLEEVSDLIADLEQSLTVHLPPTGKS
jgi:cystathionine beta-lyase